MSQIFDCLPSLWHSIHPELSVWLSRLEYMPLLLLCACLVIQSCEVPAFFCYVNSDTCLPRFYAINQDFFTQTVKVDKHFLFQHKNPRLQPPKFTFSKTNSAPSINILRTNPRPLDIHNGQRVQA